MPYTDYTAEEIELRGRAIYAEHIRDRLSTGHRGKYLVIDIETGAYKVDADDPVTSKQCLLCDPAPSSLACESVFRPCIESATGFQSKRDDYGTGHSRPGQWSSI